MQSDSPIRSASSSRASRFTQTFFHGTKAPFKPGDFIQPGFNSNFKTSESLKHVYVTATLDAAIWGAELALGEGSGRIFLVEPTGPIEDDPNLTNKKFPGNPTMSYRSELPFKVLGEVMGWQGHATEDIAAMKAGLAQLKEKGMDIIE